MHELSVASNILDVVEGALGGRRHIESVELVLGTLSGVSADSLQFCFTELAQQEGFGRPELRISETPAELRCRLCNCVHRILDFTEGCPECGSYDREIRSGYECFVNTVTIEED
jgi:hydrogenase nickel incorporation protein HypA/HybF